MSARAGERSECAGKRARAEQGAAGAGIVADSVPAKEYAETQNKAAALLRAIDLAHQQFGDGGTS